MGCHPALRRSGGGGLLSAGPAAALGGNDAPSTGYAFAAKLNIGERAACSGALVDARWVITAASCFRGGTAQLRAGRPAVKTTVTVGRTDLTQSTGTVVEAVELVPHANRDLVMVKLAWRVVGVEPVKVATKAPVVGEQLTSLGFGRTTTEWVPDKAHVGAFTVASLTGDAIALDATGDFNRAGRTDLGGLWNDQQRFNFYQGNGQGAVTQGTNAWPSPLPLPAGGQIRFPLGRRGPADGVRGGGGPGHRRPRVGPDPHESARGCGPAQYESARERRPGSGKGPRRIPRRAPGSACGRRRTRSPRGRGRTGA